MFNRAVVRLDDIPGVGSTEDFKEACERLSGVEQRRASEVHEQQRM
jgi:hypothetical protein